MVVISTDDFTTGSNQELSTYDSTWIMIRGSSSSFNVVASTDVCQGDATANDDVASYDGDEADDDQYCKADFTFQSDTYMGVACRCQAASTQDCYFWATDDDEWYLFDMNGGSWNLLSSGSHSNSTAELEIRAIGTTISGRIDGSEITSQTDSSYGSGKGGVHAYDVGTTLDNWEFGDFTVASNPIEHLKQPTNVLLRM